ncbi:MAG: UDP-N-acetylglucosamine 2-epimerase [Bacteroidota bacterium]
MNLVVLTSSRADYGIYRPLLMKLDQDPFFQVALIPFGTHLSKFHGYTIDNIKKDGFAIQAEVENLLLSDSMNALSNAMGLTMMKFGDLWATLKGKIDLIICLGDRYEMFAAVAASVPFNIPVAHLFGGETTLGAIDNKFRHAITLMSDLHFASTEVYAQRVKELIGHSEGVYNVGSLSMDIMKDFELYTKQEFKERFGIDLQKKSILVTVHPETVSPEALKTQVAAIAEVFKQIQQQYQIIITMPNADTAANTIRQTFSSLEKQYENILCVESFGSIGYLSCMQHVDFLLGNTSSGIIEASYFPKYVINVGHRQDGRIRGMHIVDAPFDTAIILDLIKTIEMAGPLEPEWLFGRGDSAVQMIAILKNYHRNKTWNLAH